MPVHELDANPAAVADLQRQRVAVGVKDKFAVGQAQSALDAAGPAEAPVLDLTDDGEDNVLGEERDRDRDHGGGCGLRAGRRV